MGKAFACASLIALTMAMGQTATAADLLRMGSTMPEDHPSTIAMQAFEKEVEARTNGQVQVDLFPNNQIGGPGEMVDQMRNGAIFGLWVGAAYFSRIVSEIEAVSLPFVFPNRETAFKVIDGEVGKMLEAKLAAKNLVPLGWMELGARHVTNNKGPLKSVNDFKGLKIRLQPNEAHIATFRALGANPVAMDVKELYSALEQGVMDGQENPYAIIETAKYAEVQKHLSDTGHFFDFIIVVANKGSFEKLSPANRAIVREAMGKAVALERELSIKKEKESLDNLKKLMTFTAVPAETRAKFLELTRPVLDDVRKRAGKELVDLVLKEAGVN